MSTLYISTPIYYVNDLPHIGHVYTTVVADTVARFERLSGREVFFATGTDEHGQNILRTARDKGIEPQEQADRVVRRYHELWRQLGISHDDFIRTTEPRHHVAVKKLVAGLVASDDLYVAQHDGWYCPSCESFYTEKELREGRSCPVHDQTTEWHSEENVFFRLSRYEQPLLDLYDRQPGFVQPASRANEVRAFVAGGLKDLSVSRADLPWGVEFPGRDGQTVYVWLDALTNYLSILGYGEERENERFRNFWSNPKSRRIHLVGKDILRFHAIYWPAFLLSAGLPLPTTVWAHGWWLRDQRKVSKSDANIVRLDDLLARFGSDPVRYFLLREMVFGQDASFSDEAFVERFNSDLANDLGNTISRLVKLSRSAFDNRTPPESCDDNEIKKAAAEAREAYTEAMDELAFSRALSALWRLLSQVNQYLVERQPWQLVKQPENRAQVSRVLWNGFEGVRIVSTALLPFMPTLAPRLLAAVGTAEVPDSMEALAWGGTPRGAELPATKPLFPRVDKSLFLAPGDGAPSSRHPDQEAAMEDGMITIDDFSKTELRVATVVAAERIPDTDKLLKLEVDLGEMEKRTLVAGIAEQYQPADLVGRQVIVVANLKPAKLRGVASQGMVLAASVRGRPVLLQPDEAVPDGTAIK